MSEKWDKEQIIFTEQLLKNKGCGSHNISCEDVFCPFASGPGDCPFISEKTGKVPTNESYNDDFDKKIKELLQQHEHDADELICKQTTPPHIGTTRVLDYVLADLKSRAEMGKQKYGHYLETNNGRNALQDAYEESLDMCMYLKQKLLEDEGK